MESLGEWLCVHVWGYTIDSAIFRVVLSTTQAVSEMEQMSLIALVGKTRNAGNLEDLELRKTALTQLQRPMSALNDHLKGKS